MQAGTGDVSCPSEVYLLSITTAFLLQPLSISWTCVSMCMHVHVYMCTRVHACMHVCGDKMTTSITVSQVLSTFVFDTRFLIGLKLTRLG